PRGAGACAATGASEASSQAARTATATPARFRAFGGVGAMSGPPLNSSPNVLADEADDVLRRGAWGEDLLDAQRLQRGDVLGRDDAAAEHRDVVGALLAQEIQHALEEIVVRAGEHAETDG